MAKDISSDTLVRFHAGIVVVSQCLHQAISKYIFRQNFFLWSLVVSYWTFYEGNIISIKIIPVARETVQDFRFLLFFLLLLENQKKIQRDNLSRTVSWLFYYISFLWVRKEKQPWTNSSCILVIPLQMECL